MAESIPAKRRLKQHAWPGRPASPSRLCGRGKRNSTGPTSALRELSRSKRARGAMERWWPGSITITTPDLLRSVLLTRCQIRSSNTIRCGRLCARVRIGRSPPRRTTSHVSCTSIFSAGPLEFRLKNITDQRLRAVVEAATGKFGWSSSKSTPEHGFGMACGTDKGGYVATCVEIEIDAATKKLRIRRVVQAWESGAIVNPDGLRNQNEGAIMQGIGGALFERILFDNGRILNPRFSQYRLPRFSDMPQIEIVLLDRKDLPSAGAGESGLLGVAPAGGSAIFAASGVRLCNMPLLAKSEAAGEVEPPFKI